jgi:hypothetical protein
MIDIRESLPSATKTGPAYKPVWVIDGKPHKFVRPVKKSGLDQAKKKVRLGNRIYAKYPAGITKKGDTLLFVGVFAAVK